MAKHAYNASFERVCLSVWLRRNYPEHFRSYSIPGDPVQNYLDPASWKCTLIWAAYNGLPLGLEKVGAVLGFEEQKLKEGKELVKYFCCPCRPTKSNGGRTWNLPHHAPDKWALFKKYNERDVQVEMQIQARLKNYPVPENIVQAVSRDILAYAMRTLSYCQIVGHVHDELIIECRPDVSLQAICEQMGRTPPWLPGIELRADGYECGFYQKQ